MSWNFFVVSFCTKSMKENRIHHQSVYHCFKFEQFLQVLIIFCFNFGPCCFSPCFVFSLFPNKNAAQKHKRLSNVSKSSWQVPDCGRRHKLIKSTAKNDQHYVNASRSRLSDFGFVYAPSLLFLSLRYVSFRYYWVRCGIMWTSFFEIFALNFFVFSRRNNNNHLRENMIFLVVVSC